MSSWLDEIETLEKICDRSNGCDNCELGYCIYGGRVDTVNNGDAEHLGDEV
jgi:hypothetical protein